MASIGNDPNGRRRILFFDRDGKRKTIRLGKVSKKDADAVKLRVEQLVNAAISGVMSEDTSRWLAKCGSVLYDKLHAVGLVEQRQETIEAEAKAAAERAAAAMPRLGAFTDAYITGRTDVKPRTVLIYEHTRRSLVDYFGAEKPLNDVTMGDTADWRRWLADEANGEGLAPNTLRKRCAIAKQFFQDAVDREIIAKNPFAKMKGNTVKPNRDRYSFVSRATAEKVLTACPDAQWRLIFALSRYGGLRCPSEHLALTWGDVNFDNGRMTVWSPKTAHHEGKESRIVPIFPELRPYLEAARDELRASEDFDPKATPMSKQPLITRYRDGNSNLRTQLLRILKRAGVQPWSRLFHNLRSTRQTELAEQFPIHAVCQWLGNSQIVAKEHYLQVTDAHFEAASGARHTHAAQQASESACTDSQIFDSFDEETAVFSEQSEFCGVGEYTRQESNLQPSDS